MAISNVQQWIKEGKSYSQGVILFKSLSHNEALIDLFESDDDDYNRERLFNELLAVDTPAEIDEPTGFKSYSELKKEKWETIHFPEDLKQLAVRSGELSKKIDFHRNQLEVIDSVQKRLEAAKIIMASVKERQKIFTEIDYFNKYGKRMEQEPEKIARPIVPSVELMIKYKNLASQICKAKKKGKIDKVKELEHERSKLKEVLGL